MTRYLDPRHWDLRFFVGVSIVLAAINLLGPKGLIRWIVVGQEIRMLQKNNKDLEHEIARIEQEHRAFESSDIMRMRMIRDELGFVKNNEYSVELPPHLMEPKP